jgi:5S rRNA maturation endonuclease (ribonuclease M5)
VLKALSLSWKDIGAEPYVERVHPYHGDGGQVLYSVERWACPKTFRCVPGLPPKGERVLYGRKWLEWARANNKVVYVVEGERDAETLQTEGFAATCNVGGAGAWYDHYALELKDLHVVVIADDDEPGRDHAREVAASLKGMAASVTLAKPRLGKDVTDHLAAGLTVADLDPLDLDEELTSFMGEDLAPEVTKWAWTGHIARGAITFIEGDPGDGKSVLTCDLAARWSSGMAMPDGSANPFGNHVMVVMVSAEDDLNMTISPRLRAHGADMSKVLCVAGGHKPTEPFDLSLHLAALERMIVKYDVKIVVLDPIMAFLGVATDSHNDASVRKALGPLAMMARRRGVAVVVVRHLNKGTGKAIYRGGGSIAFVGAARAAFLVSQHPDDEDKRVMVVVKNNLGPKGGGLVYQIVEDAKYKVAKIRWEGKLDTNAQDLLDGGDERPHEIIDFLQKLCADKPLSWKEIVKCGRDAGYTENALRTSRGRALRKAVGHEGNRDIRWEVKAHLGKVPHLGAWEPDSTSGATNGNKPSDLREQSSEDSHLRHLGHLGGGEPEAPTSGDPEQELTERYRSNPNCEVCGDAKATPFDKPWFVIRCKAHNPWTYTP